MLKKMLRVPTLDVLALDILTLLVLALVMPAFAQNLTADEILSKLEARSNSLQDASFLLTGTIYDTDGQEIPLEIEVRFIPGEELAKAYILQPDALTDNFILVDGNSVYNYLYVTNQVTILNADDPQALGDLIPAGETKGGINLTPNLGRFFKSDNWKATVEGYEESPDGPVYHLRFDNIDETANLDYVNATVLADEWLPQSLTFIKANGKPLAELYFQDYQLDTGLDPAELRELPQDAEMIDEREK